MDDREALRDRARGLRAAGMSARQVADALSIPFTSTIQAWLVGTEPPAWTRRARAKDEKRTQARELRRAGMTYPAIAAALHVSTSSVSLWVRDLPRPHRDTSAHARSISRHYWQRESRRREIDRQQTKFAAAREVGEMTARELLLVGAALYWAEGSKDKPYRRQERVVFTNSDRYMIGVFVSWLRLVGVPAEDVRYRVAIHETADVAAAERYWADEVGVDPSSLLRATVKRSKRAPGRRNVGSDYHGCLVISVVRSAVLYQRIDGWFRGISCAAERVADANRLPGGSVGRPQSAMV